MAKVLTHNAAVSAATPQKAAEAPLLDKLIQEALGLQKNLVDAGLTTQADRAGQLAETLHDIRSGPEPPPHVLREINLAMSKLAEALRVEAKSRPEADVYAPERFEDVDEGPVRKGVAVEGKLRAWQIRGDTSVSLGEGHVRHASLNLGLEGGIDASIPLGYVTAAELDALIEDVKGMPANEINALLAPVAGAMKEMAAAREAVDSKQLGAELIRQLLSAGARHFASESLRMICGFLFLLGASDEIADALNDTLALFRKDEQPFGARLKKSLGSATRLAADVAMLISPWGALASVGLTLFNFVRKNKDDIVAALRKEFDGGAADTKLEDVEGKLLAATENLGDVLAAHVGAST